MGAMVTGQIFIPVCRDAHWGVILVSLAGPGSARLRWWDDINLSPLRSFPNVQNVYGDAYDRWHIQVDTEWNWMYDVCRYGFQTDGFRRGFYVLAGMRAARPHPSEDIKIPHSMGGYVRTILLVLHEKCNAAIGESIHQFCEWRYVESILKHEHGKRATITDIDVFNYVGGEYSKRHADRSGKVGE